MFYLLKNKDRMLLSLALTIIAVWGLALWYTYTATNTWQNDRLKSRALTIATLVPHNRFDLMHLGEADITNDAYVQLKHELRVLKNANPDLVLYYAVRKSGRIIFVADSEEPGTSVYSPPGQEFTEAPQTLHDMWLQNKTYAYSYYTDRWGTWSSGFASIFDEKGRVSVVLAIDQNAFLQNMVMYVAMLGLSIIFFLMLALLFGLYSLALNEKETAAMKSDFLGMASHELRSPLSAVRWKLAALAHDDTVQPKVREALFDMEKHLAHVVSLSSTFLQFTSLDHDMLVENMRTEVALTKALWSAVAKVSIQAEQKHVTLWYSKAISTLEGVTVFGVEEYIALAIINVLGNAIKYSPENTEVTIEGWIKDNVVGIAIMDKGPGIPMTDMAKMYMPFFRTKGAIQSGKPGSGFGMYATNKVMKFHKGTIAHTPREGGGTVCTLTFPLFTKTIVH